jgi:acyl-CoA thioester hydrolase
MADPILTYRGTIYPWHCDHMGHMNVMWYVGKFDEATWQLLASVGLPATRLRQEGIGMAAVEQRIEYKRELLAGDLITIRSYIEEVREKSVRFVHEMTNQGTEELASRSTLTGVCMDMNTRRARPLPADIRERIVSAFPGSAQDASTSLSRGE